MILKRRKITKGVAEGKERTVVESCCGQAPILRGKGDALSWLISFFRFPVQRSLSLFGAAFAKVDLVTSKMGSMDFWTQIVLY